MTGCSQGRSQWIPTPFAIGLVLTAVFTPHPVVSQQIADQGNFLLDFTPGANEMESRLRGLMSNSGVLQELVDDVNEDVALLRDVHIVFGPGEEKAEYQNARIDISYAYIVSVIRLFEEHNDFDRQNFDSEFYQKILPNVGETVLHEIGHALIDVNRMVNLPATTEEIVADQLAFFIISDFYDAPEDFIPVVSQYFYRQSQSAAVVASVHPPDVQRAQNYMCWMYGYNPDLFSFLVEHLSNSDTCEDQYFALADDWDERLAPFWNSWSDPEQMFFHLVEEEGFDFEDALDEVAAEFGDAVATDFAVYLCSPEPDETCAETEVLDTWTEFLALVDDDADADEAVSTLLQQGSDERLLAGIAVYWCSPDPDTGCEGTSYLDVWRAFDTYMQENPEPEVVIARLAQDWPSVTTEQMGAFVCGHPECLAPPPPPLVRPAGPDRPSQAKRKNAQRRGTGTRGRRRR